MRNDRTLLDELIAAGEDPDPLVPGGFISFTEQIPSTGTSELSDLSERSSSPRSTVAEPGSEEEVERLAIQETAPTTRSQSRGQLAQSQARSDSQPAVPTTSQQPIIDNQASPDPIDTPISATSVIPTTQQQTSLINPIPLPISAITPIHIPAPPAQRQITPLVIQPNPPQQPGHQIRRMPLADLPARSERSAPSFDDNQPEELERYFADLETLLDRHTVNADQEKKQAALKYLKIRTENLWKTTEAWTDPTKTYDEFKAEVFKLYPGSSSDRTYTMQDLDLIIGHYARIGILTSTDLGEYYRRFLLISRYLISKNRLSTQEQSRSFLRGLPPQLEAKVRQRLQQKLIDHFPDDPYALSDIYEAVSYVLMGAGPHSVTMAPPQSTGSAAFTNPVTSPASDSTNVKLEALATAITGLSEMFKTVLQNQHVGSKPKSSGAASTGTNASGSSVCNFCGVPGHFIRECEVVEEFIRFGKCKRSPEGRVILPSGAQVPRSIQGAWLRDRVEEWHRQNPGQMAAQMYIEVMAAPPATVPPGQICSGYPVPYGSQLPGTYPAGVYALRRPLPPRPEVVITTQPPHKRGRVGPRNDSGSASSSAIPLRQPTEASSTPTPEQDASGVKTGKEPEHPQEPTHPYASVRDATHGTLPGQTKPAAKEPAAARHEPGYRNTANIYDPQVAKAVYERAMETPITVTQRELLSLAPEMRTQVAEATVRKRVPRDPVTLTMVEETSGPDDPIPKQVRFEPMPRATIEEVPDEDDRTAHNTHMPNAYAVTVRVPPLNATIIADPFETYLREHPDSHHTPDSKIVVAAESRALRAILPVVDGQDKVEAILDPGCQIVAMSEEVCNALALHYDPTIRLHMMSANGGVDQSLGLARNVPFVVGDITVYLQVHILRNPAYDILLGRPFDVLTQSIVRNFADENQTITIIDPNTGRKATIPTIPRGSFRFADRRPKKNPAEQDF